MRPSESPSFKLLAESLPHLVWTCRGDGPCDYLSPQWVAYTGIPAEEQLGFGWLDRLHPDDRDRVDAEWGEAVAVRGTFETLFRIRRHDGEYRWFQTRAVPHIGEDGEIIRWFGTNTDVQARRDVESELAQLARSLEQRDAERARQLERTTESLRETTRLLEAAQASTHVGSWSFDLESGVVRWSDELFRILGLPVTAETPPFETHHRLFTEDSWDRLSRAVRRATDDGTGYELELELPPDDGGPRFAIARCESIRDATGRVTQLRGTFQDVSELIRARREAEESARRLALAMRAADLGVWDWPVGGDILQWDTRMRELYGVAAEGDVTYATWRDHVHPDDLAQAERDVQLALDGAPRFDSTFRVVTDAGRERWVRGVAEIVRDADGRPLRLVGVNTDVTAEMLAHQLEARHASILQEFVAKAPAAIAMFDRSLRYLAASDRWIADYGLDPDAVIGRHHYELFPDLPPEWHAVHQRCLAGAIERADADRFIGLDGSEQWIDWEVRPWSTDGQEVSGLLFFTRNVTARQLLARELAAQRAELERSNADLRQFAYAASHDLQEPLRAVSGCAQLLRASHAGRLDTEADELIDHMVDGAERMRRLIDDLLAYSRVGTGEASREPVALNDAVAEARANLVATLEDSGAAVVVAPLPVVAADYGQMVQLFQNLIGNACKYAGAAPPRVRIHASTQNGRAVIVVRDHGIGIPADARERVFQVFQRLHTRAEYPGTGIGLALCRRIVERHQGRIWIEPCDGEGVEFRVELPLAA